jgi:hypothetical protein
MAGVYFSIPRVWNPWLTERLCANVGKLSAKTAIEGLRDQRAKESLVSLRRGPDVGRIGLDKASAAIGMSWNRGRIGDKPTGKIRLEV